MRNVLGSGTIFILFVGSILTVSFTFGRNCECVYNQCEIDFYVHVLCPSIVRRVAVSFLKSIGIVKTSMNFFVVDIVVPRRPVPEAVGWATAQWGGRSASFSFHLSRPTMLSVWELRSCQLQLRSHKQLWYLRTENIARMVNARRLPLFLQGFPFFLCVQARNIKKHVGFDVELMYRGVNDNVQGLKKEDRRRETGPLGIGLFFV